MLKKIYQEMECSTIKHSCGLNMRPIVIDIKVSQIKSGWEYVVQCECLKGYFKKNDECIKITENLVSSF